MQVQSNLLYDWAVKLYPEIKLFCFYGTGVWAVFKVIGFFKSLKEEFRELKNNHLHHVQIGIDTMTGDIKNLGEKFEKTVDKQTETVVDSIDNLRGDFQQLTTALIVHGKNETVVRIEK